LTQSGQIHAHVVYHKQPSLLKSQPGFCEKCFCHLRVQMWENDYLPAVSPPRAGF
jgi:hypothetical protein